MLAAILLLLSCCNCVEPSRWTTKCMEYYKPFSLLSWWVVGGNTSSPSRSTRTVMCLLGPPTASLDRPTDRRHTAVTRSSIRCRCGNAASARLHVGRKTLSQWVVCGPHSTITVVTSRTVLYMSHPVYRTDAQCGVSDIA